MAEYTLDKLLSDLQRGTYTPKTEQELQGIADRRYQSLLRPAAAWGDPGRRVHRTGARPAAETAWAAVRQAA